MRDCPDLMSLLRRPGVTFWANNGQVHFKAAKGALTDGDFRHLRANKDKVVRLLEAADLVTGVTAERRPYRHPLPLTALQKRIWKDVHERRGGLSARICIIAHRLVGFLDTDALQRSVRAVIRRHDALRIKFVLVGGVPGQQVVEDASCDMDILDLMCAADARVAESHYEEFVAERVDLLVGPLFAAKLFRVSPSESVFIVTIDHMIADAASCNIIAREIWAAYDPTVPELLHAPTSPALQFSDYVDWQDRTYRSWLEKHRQYWAERMTTMPQGYLPAYDDREQRIGKVRQLVFDETLATKLRDVARELKTLLSMVLLTICVAVMSRWLNRKDLLLAFVSNGRDRPELQEIVGFLAGYLHLRIAVEERDSFVTLLERVTAEFRSACEHYDRDRVPDLMPQCKADLFFNWLPSGSDIEFSSRGPIIVQPFRVPIELPMPPLMKVGQGFEEAAEKIVGGVCYHPDAFSAESVEQLASGLMLLAERVCQRPRDCSILEDVGR